MFLKIIIGYICDLVKKCLDGKINCYPLQWDFFEIYQNDMKILDKVIKKVSRYRIDSEMNFHTDSKIENFSSLLGDQLVPMCDFLDDGLSEESFYQTLARSFFISADMAHAVHPNYGNKHDASHRPTIDGGPVIKSNANMRYATDAFSIAKFKQWCEKAKVPFQDFCSRNDIGCGSTIGPMTAAKLGIPTIDVGNPMLSMHSIREMCGVKDHDLIIKVFTAFYKS